MKNSVRYTVNQDKLNQLTLNVGTVLQLFKETYLNWAQPRYCGNASQVNLFELSPTWLGPVQITSLDLLALLQHRFHIQCKLVQLVRVYSVSRMKLATNLDAFKIRR